MKYTKENLEPIVKNCNAVSEIVRQLGLKECGGSHSHISKLIKKFEISTLHFNKKILYKNRQINKKFTKEKFIEKILILNGTGWQSHKIKLKLFEFELKERKCEKCSQIEIWFGEKLSLQLHHENANRNDNRLENLKILCPNCHSQTKTFSTTKTNRKIKTPIKVKLIKYCNCGKIIKNRSKMCSECYHKQLRRVERPLYVRLKNDIKELGYKATGRKYGVSDNAIRKWINAGVVELA